MNRFTLSLGALATSSLIGLLLSAQAFAEAPKVGDFASHKFTITTADSVINGELHATLKNIENNIATVEYVTKYGDNAQTTTEKMNASSLDHFKDEASLNSVCDTLNGTKGSVVLKDQTYPSCNITEGEVSYVYATIPFGLVSAVGKANGFDIDMQLSDFRFGQ